jgi:hypothetical protein
MRWEWYRITDDEPDKDDGRWVTETIEKGETAPKGCCD